MTPLRPLSFYLFTQVCSIGWALTFAAITVAFWAWEADRWPYFLEPTIWLRAFAIAWPITAIATALITERFSRPYNRWFWTWVTLPGVAAPLLFFVDGY